MSYKRTSKKGYCFVQTLQHNDPVLFSYEITLEKDNYSEKETLENFLRDGYWPNRCYGSFSLKFGDQYASFYYYSSKEAEKALKRLRQLIEKLYDLELRVCQDIGFMKEHEEKAKKIKRSVKSRKKS